MNFRVVISDPKSGKAYQVELKDASANRFVGHRIGDKFDAGFMGMPGYSVEVTGGSDRQGFPLRADLPGSRRKRLLLAGGTGYHPLADGRKKRKSIHGREISAEVGQINVKIVEEGPKSVEELLGSQPKQEKAD